MSSSRRSTGLTPAAERTVARCRKLAAAAASQDSWVGFLLLTLVRDESLASACLNRLGITREWLMAGQLGDDVADAAAIDEEPDHADYEGEGCQPARRSVEALDDPMDFSRVLDRASEIARRGLNDGGVSSANLLLAILETHVSIRDSLAKAGATEERIRNELLPERAESNIPLPVDDELALFTDGAHIAAVQTPSTSVGVHNSDAWRVIDANLNRAREGLRVLEDFARFVLNHDALSHQLKTLRHDLVHAEKRLWQHTAIATNSQDTLNHRDTIGDIGTALTTTNERSRGSMQEVVVANCRRVQESLRSLEEFGKLLSADFGATAKQLRYQSYTLEKRLLEQFAQTPASLPKSSKDGSVADWRKARLQQATLYVLITESMCRLPWQVVVEQALEGGADILQLREKSLNDRELLRRSVWMRAACRAAGALFIVNDRPDIASASLADGVHVGQEEFTVEDARRVLHADQLVGVSTHSPAQADQALADGADYLGVGPMFPSQTKSFDSFPGLEFSHAVAGTIQIPWFAIGGVTLDNLALLLNSGASRIAVTSAVAASPEPAVAVRDLQRCLRSNVPDCATSMRGDS